MQLEVEAWEIRSDTGQEDANQSKIAELSSNGRIMNLGNDVKDIVPLQDGTHFIVSLDGKPTELRQINKLGEIVRFSNTGTVRDVIFSPDGKYFIVSYFGIPKNESDANFSESGVATNEGVKPQSGEFRHSDKPEEVNIELADIVSSVTFSPDSRYFFVRYSNSPSEVRESAKPGEVISFSGPISNFKFSPDGQYFQYYIW